ncbi:Rossmann-like domain-containing protein [Halobellus rarus]|uniref:Rossmann-like domain-containing protein n=1 Tax=Halobellus rarus TaxID=1126237 RepID=A0ABD6CNB8_9EURY
MSDLLDAVRDRLRPRVTEATSVKRVTVGDAAVLVELTDGESTAAGLAHRPPGDPPETTGWTVESLLAGVSEDVADGTSASVTEDGSKDRTARALGIATMNALSAPIVDWRAGDPMALLSDDVERIVTVGLFAPAFRKFDDVTVNVIEREEIESVPDPDGVRVEVFTPDETDAAMAGAEVVFVTGSAFVYGGVEAYLDAAPTSATVVVIGATASFLPDPLFEAGADVVAGATVTDAAGVRAALRRGACGTDLHDAGLRKVYVARATPSRIRLDASDGAGVSNE